MTIFKPISEDNAATPDYVDSLKRDRDRFVALAFCAADLLLEVDADGKVAFSAGATQSLLGRPPEALIGSSFEHLLVESSRSLIQELMASMPLGARIEPVPVRLNGDDGPTVALSLTGYHLPDMSGRYFFALRLSGSPTTDDLYAAAPRDRESGLPEKDAFALIASRHIEEASRRGERLELTMVHTENLQALRARLDRESAASMMQTLGSFLQANAAAGQAAGRLDENSYGFLHRSGIDIDRITGRVEEIFREADSEGVGIAVSSGTVDADIDEDDARRALLYIVNRFCESEGAGLEVNSLSDGLKVLSRETDILLTRFRDATDRGNFEVAYQPIVSLDTRALHHFEALARINGKIDDSPYPLIVFGENTGIIHDFDMAMCRRVLEELAASADRDETHVVAVNVSGHSIVNRTFVAELHDLLNRFSAVRSRVVFEVTESAKIEELHVANAFIQGLRKAGHAVCLDDFGAGSAALRYLHAFDMDYVKIDGAYVRTVDSTPRNRAFLRAVIGMCNDLEIDTIAEMVEDENTVSMLRSAGVGFGQGYLFGKPAFDTANFMPPVQARTGAIIDVPDRGLRRRLAVASGGRQARRTSPRSQRTGPA